MSQNNVQLQIPEFGSIIFRTGGIILVLTIIQSLFRNDNDTVNYKLTYCGRTVYHGITYKYRLGDRLNEHRASGKKFDDYRVSIARPREIAEKIERIRIRRDNPCYNINHTC